MFEIETSDRRVVVRTRDGHEASLELGRMSITAKGNGKKLQASRARLGDAVARLLGLLRPRHEPLVERMLAERQLVPDPPLTFEFTRLFRLLQGVLQGWQQEDPNIVEVQRRCIKVLGHVHPLLLEPAFFDEQMVIKDMLRWRAALLALDLASVHDDPIVAMRDWRGLFSTDGRPYRSLNRTLMQLPAEVDDELLVDVLPNARLERPITDPLELTLLLCVTREFSKHGMVVEKAELLRTVAHASRPEILRSLDIGVGHGASEASGRHTCEKLAQTLCWAPSGKGRLPRLALLALQAQMQAKYLERVKLVGGWDARTAFPAVDPPDVKEIRFLETVREVHEEGVLMNHCVGDSIERAVRGGVYFFHVEFRGEQATVALDVTGSIEDVNGPHNVDNDACVWAREAFDRWRCGEEPLGSPHDVVGQMGFGF